MSLHAIQAYPLIKFLYEELSGQFFADELFLSEQDADSLQ